MAEEVVMPQLGLTMTEGTLVRWLKREGENVAKGEPLIEVQSDKVTMEVESTDSGMLGGIRVQEGEVVPVGQAIAYLLEPGEEVPEGEPEKTAPPPAQPDAAPEPTAAVPRESGERVKASPAAKRVAKERGVELAAVMGTGSGGRIVEADVVAAVEKAAQPVAEGRVRASPLAKKIAKERGLDLKRIAGTGPGGRIVKRDVLAVAAAPAPTPAAMVATEGELIPLSGIKKVTAERMLESFQTAPHFYLTAEVDAGNLVELRRRLLPGVEERTGVRLSLTDLMIRIVALALREHPAANALWTGEAIQRASQANVGLAIAAPSGLLVPVIHEAGKMTISEVATRRQDLVERARSGKLALEDFEGGTFTLTNLGMYGIDVFNAILNPPQATILAVGRIADRPAVRDGQIVARPLMYVTLSSDHRQLDGVEAAQFLQRIRELVEDPYLLLI